MSDLPRKFQGVWIPADVWLDRDLTITEKVMLVEIGSLQDEKRGCYASNAHFAAFFDLSVSRVSEIISGLAAKGMVDVEQIRDGKRIVERRIRLKDLFGKSNTPSEKAMNPFGKGDEPPSEKAKGSNTPINNTGNSKGAAAQLDLSGFPEQPSEQVWADYLKHRKAKRAPVTQTVINTLAKELTTAAIAGWTVDNALAEAMSAGWQGLKAAWLVNRAGGGTKGAPISRQEALEARNRQAGQEFVDEIMGCGHAG